MATHVDNNSVHITHSSVLVGSLETLHLYQSSNYLQSQQKAFETESLVTGTQQL